MLECSSVASFLILGGGGGKTPKCTDKKYYVPVHLYCASERAPQKHIQDSNTSAYIYNQCSFLLLLMVYGAINDILTKH